MEQLIFKGAFTVQTKVSLQVCYEYFIVCLSPLMEDMLEQRLYLINLYILSNQYRTSPIVGIQ